MWMWELDHRESWSTGELMLLNCGVGENSWESLGLQGDQASQKPKGNQSWIFIGRTDAEGEDLILWTSDAKNWLIGKDPDSGKDWRWEEQGTTEDEMVGCHHWLNGWVWASSQSWWWTGKPGLLYAVYGVAKSQKWLSEGTELNWMGN